MSKVGGRGDDLLSPDLQRTAIEAYAESRGMVMAEWVEALDESGSQTRSPWWRRLDQAVQRVEDREFDAILVWKFARAARHRRQWAVALDRVETAGGVLESATEQLDTRTSTGRLARGMLAELAAWEAEVKGEQWKEVHASRLARGLPATGRRRFGYAVSREGGFVPDAEEGPFVKAMYERFIQGDTHTTICQWLDREGIRTTTGGYWHAQSLARYMDSGFAAGVLSHGGRTYRGTHEALIAPGVWAAYQRVRDTTRRQAPRTRAATHPLAGLVKCGVCHGPACLSNAKGRKGRYRCCKQGVLGAASCSGVTINAGIALDGVREWLWEVASELDPRANVLAEQKARAAKARGDAGRARKEVDRLDEALARLAVQSALLPASALQLANDDLLRLREEAVEKALVAENDAAALASPAPRLARSILGSWDQLVEVDPKGLRDVLAALIARVEIVKGEGRTNRVEVIPRWKG